MPKRQARIEGDIAYIPLTRGYEAIIDAADLHMVADWDWCAQVLPRAVYAVRGAVDNGKRRTILMHRHIAQAAPDMHVDHRDGNGLNNRKSNIRQATVAQNAFNQGMRKTNTSGFKGVSWQKATQKWVAQIRINGKNTGLGGFDTPEEAHSAYVRAAKEHHRDFARTA